MGFQTSIGITCVGKQATKEGRRGKKRDKGPLAKRVRRGVLAALLPIGLGAALERVAFPPPSTSYTATNLDETPNNDGLRTIDTSSSRRGAEEGSEERARAAVVARARELFREADAARAAGRWEEAAASYTWIIDRVPEWEYVLIMKSLMGRRDCFLALGRREEARADNTREFLGGRGIRWPFWYIISAILLRNEIAD